MPRKRQEYVYLTVNGKVSQLDIPQISKLFEKYDFFSFKKFERKTLRRSKLELR